MNDVKKIARFLRTKTRTATEVAKYLGCSRQWATLLLNKHAVIVGRAATSRQGRPASLYGSKETVSSLTEL